ncbi:hypothetical protein [Arthrobacter psychrochitiniphilus]|uniref:hypothetical protein n=1 Tax=Arthrobacter psychrochitiniphilus TaxID=291045 RepID=UPI003F7B83F8
MFAEVFYGDEAPGGFYPDSVFDPRRLAAGMPLLQIDELVHERAVALVLLESVV